MCHVQADESTERMVQRGNCIGFIKNGDGSAGYAIYREGPFISSSDVIYGYADWLNRATGLFFVTAQDMIKPKYSHGYKRNREHLLADRVMLPADDDGEPDFQFMEEYGRSMIARKYAQYLQYLESKAGGCEAVLP